MTVSTNRYHDNEVARLIRERLDALGERKSLSQISSESGFEKSNILLMFAAGEMRVPIDRALPLAKALEVDPAAFFRIVLTSHCVPLEGIIIADGPAPFSSRPNVDLNFKVDPDFHKLFKTQAIIRGMTMKELLEASFKAFLEANP